jgi:dihydroflavonol-4-reductase
MKVLVTGATGLIGSHLTQQLLEAGDEVVVFRREDSRLDLLGAAARHVEHRIGDIRDVQDVLHALRGIDSAYHTAAFLGFGGRRDESQLHDVNVSGTAHVVNAAVRLGTRRVVFTSSIAALGRTSSEGRLIDETTPWSGTSTASAYARSKHLAELEVHRGIAEGLDGVIVNPALVFGPGRTGENTGALVDAIRRGRLPAYPTAGVTCVVDVADVAAGHRFAMARGQTGERYLLGSENLAWKEIFIQLAEAFGVKPPSLGISPAWIPPLGMLAEWMGRVLGRSTGLTRETARSVGHAFLFSNRKAVEELGATFVPFRETARRLADTWPR